MTRTRKHSLILTALAGITAFSLAVPAASAQINIYLGAPPPPIQYQARPPLPGPGYSWVDGFWQPYNRGYRWQPGVWQQPPYPGAYYIHPHYDHYKRGWRLHQGYWSREDHNDHHGDNEDGDQQGNERGEHHDNGNHYGERKHEGHDKHDD